MTQRGAVAVASISGSRKTMSVFFFSPPFLSAVKTSDMPKQAHLHALLKKALCDSALVKCFKKNLVANFRYAFINSFLF